MTRDNIFSSTPSLPLYAKTLWFFSFLLLCPSLWAREFTLAQPYESLTLLNQVLSLSLSLFRSLSLCLVLVIYCFTWFRCVSYIVKVGNRCESKLNTKTHLPRLGSLTWVLDIEALPWRLVRSEFSLSILFCIPCLTLMRQLYALFLYCLHFFWSLIRAKFYGLVWEFE